MSKTTTFIIGNLAGAVIVIVLFLFMAPSLMIMENTSRYGFQETVEAIKKSAASKGWKTPVLHELDKAVAKAGFKVKPVTVIELCQPQHAGKILSKDKNRVVSSMMPCRVSVYETSDGKVIVSRMNSSLVSRLFGGEIADVMADAYRETEVILSSVI